MSMSFSISETGAGLPMEITGRGGRELADAWRDGAEAYLGLSVSGFPNFFMTYGPNTNLGHNSIIFMIECQTAYVMDAIRQLRERGVRWMDLSPGVQRAYNERVQRTLAGRVWADVDHSWYKNAAGKITNNWCGTTLEYWWRTRRCDLSKYRLASDEVVTPVAEPVTVSPRTAAAVGS